MMIHVPQVLTSEELAQCRAILEASNWLDGRDTAGSQAALVKRNLQLPEQSEASQSLQAIVLAALNRNALFFTAALPKKILPPYFNCYTGEMNTFGNHVDGSIRTVPGTTQRVRSDVSCTLFFSDPEDYEGGELVVDSLNEKEGRLHNP